MSQQPTATQTILNSPPKPSTGVKIKNYIKKVDWRIVLCVMFACAVFGWILYYIRSNVNGSSTTSDGTSSSPYGSTGMINAMRSKARESWGNIDEMTQTVLNKNPSLVSNVTFGRFPSQPLGQKIADYNLSYGV